MSNRYTRIIRPQEGYQMKALASPADILIGGGAAGVGKTFSLLLEPLRHKENPNFGAVCFRRTSPQIRNQGGLWDTSMGLYPFAGGKPKETVLEWSFSSGSRVSFKHLQHENDKFEWQGSQIPLLMFDELTHFSESTFFYMLSRNRSDCGVAPYVRATCNPDPESWVAQLIDWWIDSETGFPIPEREGVVRYFAKHGDNYIWGNSKAEVIEAAWYFLEPLVNKSGQKAEDFVKSITFISGSIYDNKALLTVDSGYLANLAAQDEQTRLQLLEGNWKVVISDLDIYNYPAFAGLFTNLREVDQVSRYITADIAGMGSDKFVVGAWHGRELADVITLAKSDGPKVVETIANMAKAHSVPNHHIAYDADGIGSMYTGFAPGSIAFNNGAKPLPDPVNPQKDPKTGNVVPENYANLKTQCYYRSGKRVAEGDMAIADEVAAQMYDTKMTTRQRFMHERKAIKRDKADADGKLRIIPKEQMKVILGGESPDLMDMFCMREIFDLKPKPRTWEVG